MTVIAGPLQGVLAEMPSACGPAPTYVKPGWATEHGPSPPPAGTGSGVSCLENGQF